MPPQDLGPCDFCGAPQAGWGFAPPPRLRIPVRRPIRTCFDQTCRAKAQARVDALIAKHDPLAAARTARGDSDLPTPSQGTLFG